MSSCFVCSQQVIPRKILKTARETNLKSLLVTTCKLLNISGISEEEWDFLNTIQDSVICSCCTHNLQTLQTTFDLLQKTQENLRKCLLSVEETVQNSTTTKPIKVSLWRSCCYQFRNQLSSRIAVKDTSCSNDLSTRQVNNKPDGIVENDGDTHEVFRAGKTHRRKRKILVIAEEDDEPHMELPNWDRHPHNNFQTSGLEHSSLQKEGEGLPEFYDNDRDSLIDYDDTQNVSDLQFSNDKCPLEVNSVNVNANYAKRQKCSTKKKPKIVAPPGDPSALPPTWKPLYPPDKPITASDRDGIGRQRSTGRRLDLPYLIINDNLFIYKKSVFVEYNFTHLICKAIGCSFKIPFDYYSSFQALRDHLEQYHRGYMFRRKAKIACLVCHSEPLTFQGFLEHFRTSHPHLNVPTANGICECCLRPLRINTVNQHQFTHKNNEEALYAVENGIGPATARKRKRLEGAGMDTWIWCNMEDCDGKFSMQANYRHHLRKVHNIDPETYEMGDLLGPVAGEKLSEDALVAAGDAIIVTNASLANGGHFENDVKPELPFGVPTTVVKECPAPEDVDDFQTIASENDDDCSTSSKQVPTTSATGPTSNKVRAKGKHQFLPMLVIRDNLFLYLQSTFVEYNYTHLSCKAVGCSFKVPFDFYPSFQAMRKHIEDNHRGYRFRRKAKIACHACLNPKPLRCKTFSEHFRAAHPELKSRAKGICECCLRQLHMGNLPKHQFSHKNPEEVAAARKQGKGPALLDSERTDKPFKCPHPGCGFATKQAPKLKQHSFTHMPPEERPDTCICPECGQMLTGKASFNTHMRRVHCKSDDVQNVVHCPHCDKKFLAADRSLLNHHVNKFHRDLEKNFICDECGKGFLRQGELNMHVRDNHETGEWLCCGKIYTKHRGYKYHWMKYHKELPFPALERPHTSKPRIKTGGPNKFYNELEERREAKKLAPKRKWPCDQCDVVCVNKAVLERHKLRIHQGIDVHARWKKKPEVKDERTF